MAIAKLRCTARFPQLARTLLGETPRFFHEHILVKERDTHEITPWHHDEPYYCIDGASNVSLWVSLDPVPRAAGVEFIVGSHRWGRRFVPRKFVDHVSYVYDASGFELVPDIDSERDQHEIVSFDDRAGRRDRVPLPHPAFGAGYRWSHADSPASGQLPLPG